MLIKNIEVLPESQLLVISIRYPKTQNAPSKIKTFISIPNYLNGQYNLRKNVQKQVKKQFFIGNWIRYYIAVIVINCD